MPQDTTPVAPAVPPLLRELWRLLAAHRPAVRQRAASSGCARWCWGFCGA